MPLPSWAMKKYSILWKAFASQEFTHIEAQDLLRERWQELSILIYKLKKNGWIEVRKDRLDGRKRIYKLVEPNLAIGGMGNE